MLAIVPPWRLDQHLDRLLPAARLPLEVAAVGGAAVGRISDLPGQEQDALRLSDLDALAVGRRARRRRRRRTARCWA